MRIRRDALAGYGWMMFSTNLAENDINKVVKVDGFIFPGPSPSDNLFHGAFPDIGAEPPTGWPARSGSAERPTIDFIS